MILLILCIGKTTEKLPFLYVNLPWYYLLHVVAFMLETAMSAQGLTAIVSVILLDVDSYGVRHDGTLKGVSKLHALTLLVNLSL